MILMLRLSRRCHYVKIKAMKEFIKEIGVYLFGALSCFWVFFLENRNMTTGKAINTFLQCEQNPASSTPCYATYDLIVMIPVLILGLILLGIFIWKTAAYLKKGKK